MQKNYIMLVRFFSITHSKHAKVIMLSNKHADALKSNALSMALLVPQTVQGLTGQELSLRGSVEATKLQLIESLCRQCRDEQAVATRDQQAVQQGVSSWQRVKNACASGQATIGSLRNNMPSTTMQGTNARISAAASGAYSGIVSIPSKLRSQAEYDVQLTKELFVDAKNWVTNKKSSSSDKHSTARVMFDQQVALATGEETECGSDVLSECGSDVYDDLTSSLMQ